MRQYFHKGLLWRAQEAQEVASYELFVDLFYVGIIAIAGDGAAEEATGEALLRFAVTFILSWKFWSDISQMISWFDADDIMRRFTTLFVLTCLLGLTVNIAGSMETTYTPMIAFYLASRWFIALYYLWMAYLIPMVRGAMVITSLSTFVPGLIWIASVHVHEPNRQALIWIAIAMDIFGPMLMVGLMRAPNWMGQKYQCWAKTRFDFIPGQNIEHKIERTNAFVTLVFGYSVIALLYQSAVPFGLNAFFGKAVLGLIQAFTFNWLYFEIDKFNMHTHAIRRHFFSGKSLRNCSVYLLMMASSECLALCPSPIHPRLRTCRFSPLETRSSTRYRPCRRRRTTRTILWALRRTHFNGFTLVLLRRPFGRLNEHGYHLPDSHFQRDTICTSSKTFPPRSPLHRRDRNSTPSIGWRKAQLAASGCDNDFIDTSRSSSRVVRISVY